jgi:hypothetical protein
MESSLAWHRVFLNWPNFQTRGLIVTKYGESIPFIDFVFSESMLLVDRGTPDAQGSRKVFVSYEQIAVLKISGTEDFDVYKEGMGFQSPRSSQQNF